MIQYAFSNYKKMPQKCTWYEEEDSDDWLFACKCGLVLTKDDNPNSEVHTIDVVQTLIFCLENVGGMYDM